MRSAQRSALPTASAHGKCTSIHYIVRNPGLVWDTLVNIPVNVPICSTFLTVSSAPSVFVSS